MTTVRHNRPGWEAELLKNATTKVFNNGIHSWWWGQGPVVLLVHGWDGRGSQLGRFVNPLVEAGFQVVAFDGPAHGDSPGMQTNLSDFSRHMLEVQAEIASSIDNTDGNENKSRDGVIYGAIGHSFGAAALMLATKRGLNLKKVVLIASPCSLQDVFNRYTAFMKLSQTTKNYFRDFLELYTQLKIPDVQVNLIAKQLKASGLVVHDQSDDEIPYQDAIEIVKTWPGAELYLTQGLGHRRILKSREVIERVKLFLQQS